MTDFSSDSVMRPGDNADLAVYQEVIEGDRVKPAPDMLESFRVDLGTAPLSMKRYTSVAYHKAEVERMWSRVWQMACREEQIPEVGDVVVYNIAHHSILVVRSGPDEIKAFHNSCLHRGTKLCMTDTSVPHLRCPYHGFTWALDGQLKEVPARWDFPQIDEERHRLPEVKVGRWAGFVFINLDPHAPPLEDYLEDFPDHLGRMAYEDHYVSGHYSKVLPCNWKTAIEAFIEAYHVAETHYQSQKTANEVATQYDILPGRRHTNRNLQPRGLPSAYLDPQPTDQEVLDAMFQLTHGTDGPPLPEGQTARNFLADKARSDITARTGHDYSAFSDSEMLDSLQYFLFPNIVMFRSTAVPIVYRSRPNGDDPNTCVFEMILVTRIPKGEERPEPAQVFHMGDLQYSDCKEFPPYFARLFDQDVSNLRAQQEGFNASVTGVVELSRYQEVRIRHLHQTLDSYVGTVDC